MSTIYISMETPAQRELRHRKEFIVRKINILNMEYKNQLCKFLLTMGVDVKQTNNGAYCFFDDMEERLVNFIYDFVKANLK